jgi:hypothetical protein
MKIKKTKLEQILAEEITNILFEQALDPLPSDYGTGGRLMREPEEEPPVGQDTVLRPQTPAPYANPPGEVRAPEPRGGLPHRGTGPDSTEHFRLTPEDVERLTHPEGETWGRPRGYEQGYTHYPSTQMTGETRAGTGTEGVMPTEAEGRFRGREYRRPTRREEVGSVDELPTVTTDEHGNVSGPDPNVEYRVQGGRRSGLPREGDTREEGALYRWVPDESGRSSYSQTPAGWVGAWHRAYDEDHPDPYPLQVTRGDFLAGRRAQDEGYVDPNYPDQPDRSHGDEGLGEVPSDLTSGLDPKTGEPGYGETLARNRRSSEGLVPWIDFGTGRQWYAPPDWEEQARRDREKEYTGDLQRRRQEESSAFEQAVAEGGEAEAIRRLSQPAPQRQYVHPDNPTRPLTGEEWAEAVRDPVRNAELTSAWFVPEYGAPGEVSGYRPATEREAELGRNWRLTDDATRQMTGRGPRRGDPGLVHQGPRATAPFQAQMTPDEAQAFLSDKEYEDPRRPRRSQRRMSRQAQAAKEGVLAGTPGTEAWDAANQAAMEYQAEYGAERRRYEASAPAYRDASRQPGRYRGWWWDPNDPRNMGLYDPDDPEAPRSPWASEAGEVPLSEFVEREVDKILNEI